LGVSFIFLLFLLVAPYIVLYFLPYGFLVNRSFTQMPGHILAIAAISNTSIYSLPIIASVVMYIKLTLSVKQLNLSLPEVEDHMADLSSKSDDLRHKHWHRNVVAPKSQQSLDVATPNAINEASSEGSDVDDIKVIGEPTVNNVSSTVPSNVSAVCHEEPNDAGSVPRRPSMEIEAALRSMKTNLLMLLLFFLNCLLLLIPSDTWRMFAAIIFQSALKFLLPTVTTISNFGPVKEVVAIYLQRMLRPRSPSA
jgi:hypothetical protein